MHTFWLTQSLARILWNIPGGVTLPCFPPALPLESTSLITCDDLGDDHRPSGWAVGAPRWQVREPAWMWRSWASLFSLHPSPPPTRRKKKVGRGSISLTLYLALVGPVHLHSPHPLKSCSRLTPPGRSQRCPSWLTASAIAMTTCSGHSWILCFCPF